MTYELAKKLKDAGFEQKVKRPEFDYEKNNATGEVVIIPTLIQLIEACGDDFRELQWIGKGDKFFAGFGREGFAWKAKAAGKKIKCGNCNTEKDGPVTIGFGSSAEEAVADLWLELHEIKKKKE